MTFIRIDQNPAAAAHVNEHASENVSQQFLCTHAGIYLL